MLDILKFPKVELCHETYIHNKVYSDICLAIPEGEKYFAWFTKDQSKYLCYLIKIADNTMTVCDVNFSKSLTIGLGTIVSGTIFKHKNKCFAIDDLHYYKGEFISKNYVEKITCLTKMFDVDIYSIKNENSIVFGMPVISNYLNLLNEIPTLSYPIKYIQFKYFDNNDSKLMQYNNEIQYTQFNVNATIQNDIYELCAINSNKKMTAYIPDYKTSVMMNKLFRNIKENVNLDALEESDDDEEFENNKSDKFVYLERSYKMMCIFNNKFKKWIPIKLC